MKVGLKLGYRIHTLLNILRGRDYVRGGVLRASRKRIRQIREHLEVGHRVLEIGTGSGILAKVAIEKGAGEMIAVDINPAAVKQAKKLVPEATVLESDLFEMVEGKFDTILFAPPWSEGTIVTPFHHAIYDCGVLSRFLREAKAFLEKDGHIWIQYSDESLLNFRRFHESLKENGYKVVNSWSYEDWAIVVKRNASIFLYKLGPEDK